MIPGARPLATLSTKHRAALLADFDRILTTGHLVLGPYTDAFEAAYATYVGTRHAVAVGSCSAALEITLREALLRATGPTVLVPTNTFPATVAAVHRAGGQPHLVDLDSTTFGMDLGVAMDILRRTPRGIAAVVVVHIAGHMDPRLLELAEACQEAGALLVEDCAHAHGATLHNVVNTAGRIGWAGCFSFYPTKVVTTGVGGLITTDDGGLAAYARSMRHHGAGPTLDHITERGGNALMSEFAAALGLHQLQQLPILVATRRRIADWYADGLDGDPRVHLPLAAGHAYYKQPLLLRAPYTRAPLAEYLAQSGISVGALYDPPVHRQPAWARHFMGEKFPVADRVLPQQVCLPFHTGLDAPTVQMICRTVRRGLDVLRERA